MKSRRWFFVWLLPVTWGLISITAAFYPGDEYALFAVGSMAGLWIIWLFDDNGGFWAVAVQIIAAGSLVMAVVGLILDLFRAPRRLWGILWPIVAAAVLATTLSRFPSYQRAMSKHGSLQAYICFALNLGLSYSCALMLVIAPFLRWRYRRLPPGHCEHCGYDLTGNVSGRCPECGDPARPEGSPADPG